jgi:predicted TIM-barrel fold metal-dependent hydrolase
MSTTTTSELVIDPRVGFPMYDADQHYYEATDAITRHLPQKYQRLVRWVDIDGRHRLLLGGHLFSKQPNAAYDPIARPGALIDFFRGHNPEGKTLRDMLGQEEPNRPEYRQRDRRLEVMDSQGVAATLLLPSLGLYIEEAFKRDRDALYALLESYNTWLEQDWGFAYQNRIFTGPILSLIEPDRAVAQVKWAAARGARFVVLRPGPVTDGTLSWSVGDPRHDPVWQAVVDANMFAAFHAADAGYEKDAERWGESEGIGYGIGALTDLLGLHTDRPIQETIAALVAHKVFGRNPDLRIATIELGSRWALDLFDRMRSGYGQKPYLYDEDPSATFRKHVWISPYYEDDFARLRDDLGADRIMLGSDWPHPEGLVLPGDYVEDIKKYSDADRQRVLADNLRELLGI